jgi:hypothetical protein
MALWRCPTCGTPQPVAARCWVCRRSSTSCGTCRHYRASVAAGLGYCGLDRDRLPLAGSEIRTCWDGFAVVETDDVAAPAIAAEPAPVRGQMAGFVPVESLLTPADGQQAADNALVDVPAADASETAVIAEHATAVGPSGGLLWADLET